MIVKRYSPAYQQVWDSFIDESRNGTFLLKRPYMDYHADRFPDHSLLICSDSGKVLAVLPAHEEENATVLASHNGLTYGGFIIDPKSSTADVGQFFKLTIDYLLSNHFMRWTYKPIPHIYHTTPCEEDLFWIYRLGGRLIYRNLSSAIPLHNPLPFSTLRNRKIKSARNYPLEIRIDDWSRISDYWDVLSQVLESRHHTTPTHSLAEIELLHSRFPQHIQLATCYNGDTLLAGIVVYVWRGIAHLQYIAAGAVGLEQKALDALIAQLISHYKNLGLDYFDFGISTEDGGAYLNRGLVFQKEGFGGRGICYDEYEIELSPKQLTLF
ncbi:MAG: GNAT family N-acetyltransferase [Alloprevotella sp.]|nr:GNAT family N-acetyltransferase [Alloprevotella sp.]